MNTLILIQFTVIGILLLLILGLWWWANKEPRGQKTRDEFVDLVAHELRSPMTSIAGFVTLILQGKAGPVTEAQKKFLEIVANQSGRLLRLIEDLLDLSRIEEGKVTLRRSAVLIEDVIEHAVSEMQPQIESRRQRLVHRITPNLPEVELDDGLIRQVLVNLLSNAVKFTPDEGEITVGAKLADRHLQIFVEDNGGGIEARHLTRIFDRFYRVGGFAQQVKGTGLGLAISRKVVELHGGKIWAESEGLNKGSRFVFTLPVR